MNHGVKSYITMVADTCVAAYLCAAAYSYIITYLAIMPNVAMLKHPSSGAYRSYFGSTGVDSYVARYYAVITYHHLA
jgi:hypothetical protein